MSCLTESAVEQFVGGEMDSETASSVDRHMAECPPCRGWVADAAKLAFSDGMALPSAEELERSPGIGDVVGRYRLVDVLGVGGMGVVFAAEDPDLGRRIALKLIRADLGDDSGAELTKRLRHEARAMAKISHPNVVSVYDIGAIGDHLFVAMEHVHGKTLRAWCSSAARTWTEILDVFIAAGRGLAAGHDVGIVHRDFKPENVLYGDDGRARVTDFGLARSGLGAETARESIRRLPFLGGLGPFTTRNGQIAGTPAYMAPEQLEGSPGDARSDQFSFAVALFEALYGIRPYPASDLRELTTKLARGEIASPPSCEVPPGIESALRRSLRRAPHDRHPSVRALLEELAAVRERASVPPAAASRPRRWMTVSVLALAVLGIGGTAVAKRRLSAMRDPLPTCRVEQDGRLHCGNAKNAPIHVDPALASPPVNALRTTTSWFDCWTADDASSIWYRTLGDYNDNWGWVAAEDVRTSSEFNADPSARGLKHCVGRPPLPPPPLPANCKVDEDHQLPCVNSANSQLYREPRFDSDVVDRLRTKKSTFKCWTTGEYHSGGNTTWYLARGEEHGEAGWAPGVQLGTPKRLDVDPQLYGLPRCD